MTTRTDLKMPVPNPVIVLSKSKMTSLVMLIWHGCRQGAGIFDGRSLALALFLVVGLTPKVIAQTSLDAPIVPDNTLPNPSVVEGGDRSLQIGGGTTAGQNLFHSFERFSVPTDHTVHFVPNGDIARIIARVTGGDGSLIDGVLGSNTSAALFLINPNGISFGPNAQLQLGGSFVASTAESMVFVDGAEFRAGGNSGAAPLLTATVPLGLQLGAGSGNIVGIGRGPIDLTETPGLTVLPGQTLGFLGASLEFSGVAIAVPSGDLQLGAVTSGTVGLGDNLQFSYDGISEFGDLTLQLGSSVTGLGVIPQNPGTITLAGDDVTLSRSQVISLTLGTAPGPPITINSAGTLSILGAAGDPVLSTGIFSAVPPDVGQNGGAISTTARRFIIRNGGRLQSSTEGAGAAGDIQVRAGEIDFDGFTPVGPAEAPTFDNSAESAISSITTSLGDSGRLNIRADRLRLTNGAVIETASAPEASGRARSVNLAVTGDLIMVGGNPENAVQTSRIATLTFGEGSGESVTIQAGSAQLADGAQIGSVTSGRQGSGDLRVVVDGLLLISGENLTLPGQGAGSTVATIAFGTGKGGDIVVDADHIRIEDGASLGAQALNNFLGVTTIPEAGGSDSGQVIVRANLIELVGTSVFNPAVPSNIASATFGSGDAGSVVVEADNLRILNGGTLASSTLISFIGTLEQPNAGRGNGGDLEVRVRDSIEVAGAGVGGEFPSTLGANTASFGDAGRTQIQAQELIIRDGGLVNSAAFALGDAGSLTVEADYILIEGRNATNGLESQIAASALTPPLDLQDRFGIPAGSSGDTGQVTVIADRIDIRDRGQISVQHDGTGNAGALTIDAGLLTLGSGGQIRANTVAGTGGNAVVRSGSLQLRDDSQVSVEAGSIGNGGNLTLETDTLALLEDSTIRANAVRGQGGNIAIISQGLFLGTDSQITASSQLGIDGTVQVERPEVDPGSELIQLPATVVDSSDSIATGCAADGDNRFVARGQGSSLLTDNTPMVLWEDLRLEAAEENLESDMEQNVDAAKNSRSQITVHPSPAPIVEAQRWQLHADGSVALTSAGQASLPTANCHSISAADTPAP
ncbi:MAG: filamentous hemagglutinin N-terminal domain-containing protein [Cyanobacteria bacterium P01_F01_bin.153]